jgi:hypothetical protein
VVRELGLELIPDMTDDVRVDASWLLDRDDQTVARLEMQRLDGALDREVSLRCISPTPLPSDPTPNIWLR